MDLLDRLTILIPTYNRKERLLGTLHSIASQGHWGEYDVVIVDNCSNYSVEEAIKEEFADGFSNSVTVHRWFFNTGMSTNISIAFEYVKTKWCWFISDDDKITEGALEIILADCKKYPDYSAIKYSIESICKYDDTTIRSVEEWANYYNKYNTGDKCYLAMLYNINVLYPYMSELTIHSYCYLSFWLPVIRAINEANKPLFMSSSVLYNYQPNVDGWSSTPERFLNTLVGIRTMFDTDYGLSNNSYKALKSMISSNLFDGRAILSRLFQVDDLIKRRRYYLLLKDYFVGSSFSIGLYKMVYSFFSVAPFCLTILKKIKN